MDIPLEMQDYKIDIDTDKPICRCCLSTENRMLDATRVSHYFMDLANINVFSPDGLPLWICYECQGLLRKAVAFKYKMLRSHSRLYEYITRCAPFPISAGDPELAQLASPALSTTHTLSFDTGKNKLGYHKVLQHEKRVSDTIFGGEMISPPMVIEASRSSQPVFEEEIAIQERELATGGGELATGGKELATGGGELVIGEGEIIIGGDVKAEEPEGGDTDYEDNLPLGEIRSASKDTMSVVLAEIKTEPEAKKKKKKKEKDVKTRKRKKKEIEDTEEPPPKKSIRKPIEIDPQKIKIITLDPEEQVRQREEESKASLKFPYQCNLCFKGFNFESKLQNHMHKHSPSRGPFTCVLCRMHFPTAYSHAVHSLAHTRRYQCRCCGATMTDRQSMYHHYRTQHEGIATIITCNICGKQSSNYKTHRGHMRNHHSGERPKCDQCGKTFVNKDSLTEHLQIHEGVKNYECSVCGKRCRTRTQIKQHQLKHADTREYYCVECDVRFKTSHSLRQHLQKSLKHRDVDSLPYACSRCPARFPSAGALAAHAGARHEGVRYACGACGAALSSRAALRKHAAAVHLGRRAPPAHVCHHCGKAFRGKSVLTNHLRTHTGEKPFTCTVCGRAFSQRTAMRTHLRRVHCAQGKTKVESTQTEQPTGFAPKEEPAGAVWPPTQDMFYVTAGP